MYLQASRLHYTLRCSDCLFQKAISFNKNFYNQARRQDYKHLAVAANQIGGYQSLSTTTVNKINSSSPVLIMLCAEPFLHIWQQPAVRISSSPSQVALPVPERT